MASHNQTMLVQSCPVKVKETLLFAASLYQGHWSKMLVYGFRPVSANGCPKDQKTSIGMQNSESYDVM